MVNFKNNKNISLKNCKTNHTSASGEHLSKMNRCCCKFEF